MTNPVNQELKQRRSIYALGKMSPKRQLRSVKRSKKRSANPQRLSTPKQSALLSLLVKIPIVFGISLKLN